mgnify:FL=1
MNNSTLTVKTSAMRRIDHIADLCIIGGGLSGMAAALCAARRGTRVLLMQDRPVLGGNASSEIRMWVRGAKGLHNRETGIVSELEEENIYRNPTLCYSIWDSVMWGKVKDDPNIELLLNCSCVDAETEDTPSGRRIKSVVGWQLTTYTWHTVKAKYFSDCSGDSVLATLTGAEWRVGREGRGEFGETIGPEVSDKKTMGMSCLLQARETEAPVKFIPPEWAYVYPEDSDFIGQGKKKSSAADKKTAEDADFIWNGKNSKTAAEAAGEKSATELLANGASISGIEIKTTSTCTRTHALGTSKGNFWWIELGGENDSIHDTEWLRDELLKIAFGIWDHIKNHGDHHAENWELEWVGFLPGKRESRRYVGPYTLTQNDVEAGGKFDDVIAYGGWPMDDHNPGGFKAPADESASTLHPTPSPYGIPYRVLYSANIENMFFAGRNISATHAAISSTRVMATCSLLGQAVGEAAAICVAENIMPAQVSENYVPLLQERLLDDGCYLPGLTRSIPELTKSAKINLPAEELALLQNGMERPDAEMTRNYAELDKGSTLEFDFGEERQLDTLRLVFDPDFSRESISPDVKMRVFAQRCNRSLDFGGVKVADTLVKSFTVECDGKIVYSTDNCHNSLVRIPLGLSARRVSIRFDETWGANKVHLFSADIS